jgi:uncharacterized protein with gpF-like domain
MPRMIGRGVIDYRPRSTYLPGREPRRTSGGINYASLYEDLQKRESGARAANIAREKEIRGIYGQEIAQYEEGGAFKQAGLADIERTKTRAIGAGTQQMISSGMYGTTTAASIPVQAEAQAGQARLKLEDLLQQRVTQAKRGLAGFVERIEDPYPDYNMLLQAYIAQGQR